MRRILPLLVLALSSLAAADDIKSVEKLLTKMRMQYKGIKSAVFTTNGVRTMQGGRKVKLRSETHYIAPGKVYSKVIGAKTVAKEPVAFVTNGVVYAVTGMPSRGGVEKFNPNQTQLTGLVPLNLESLCFWDYGIQLNNSKAGNMGRSKLSLASESWKDKQWTILREQVDGLDIKYFIDPKSSLIWRTVVKRNADKTVVGDFYLESLKVNAKVNDNLFAVLNPQNLRKAHAKG